MQKRHQDRQLYFEELATTSNEYLLPYIAKYKNLNHPLRILELGCGDGGNLMPFAKGGHDITGIDLCEERINDAGRIFKEKGLHGNFYVDDICTLSLGNSERFDVILCHDVIEHIAPNSKATVLKTISNLLKDDGVAFVAFPSWYMPFGGHQQICRNRWISRLPWVHLLPAPLYRRILHKGKESEACIKELLAIKTTRMTIGNFERLVTTRHYLSVINRTLYLINPHYKVKFGLSPVILPRLLTLPPLRDCMSTTCFYLLKKKRR